MALKKEKSFAAWFKYHVVEEMSHAAKLIEYMLERRGLPTIPATKAPKTKHASPLAGPFHALLSMMRY